MDTYYLSDAQYAAWRNQCEDGSVSRYARVIGDDVNPAGHPLLFDAARGVGHRIGLSPPAGDVLDGADLVGISFYGLRDVSFRRADLKRAHFGEGFAYGCDFSGAFLGDACFRCVNGDGSMFGGAVLLRADFSRSCFVGSDFSSSCCRGACFRGARLKGARFRGTDLSDADFRGADLSGAAFASESADGMRYLRLGGIVPDGSGTIVVVRVGGIDVPAVAPWATEEGEALVDLSALSDRIRCTNLSDLLSSGWLAYAFTCKDTAGWLRKHGLELIAALESAFGCRLKLRIRVAGRLLSQRAAREACSGTGMDLRVALCRALLPADDA